MTVRLHGRSLLKADDDLLPYLWKEGSTEDKMHGRSMCMCASKYVLSCGWWKPGDPVACCLTLALFVDGVYFIRGIRIGLPCSLPFAIWLVYGSKAALSTRTSNVE